MSKRKIVVTGAAGFIGSQLSKKLVQLGHDVHLLDNLSYGCIENITINGSVIGSFHKKDVRDSGLKHIFAGADAVIHLAAISALPVNQSQPQQAIDINVGGTANVLETARLCGVRRVIFASTSAIYENNKTFPCHEEDAVAPTLIYSISKQQAELLCRGIQKTYGMEIVITRYYNVYGPQQDLQRKSPAFVGYVIRELLQGRAPVLHSNGEQRRDYVHVDDVNDINLLCLDSPVAPGQTYNVASEQAWSVNQIYAMIARAVGSDVAPVFRPAKRFWEAYPELFDGPYPISESKLIEEVDKFTLGNASKAKAELGWAPKISIDAGLQQTVHDMRRRLQSLGTA